MSVRQLKMLHGAQSFWKEEDEVDENKGASRLIEGREKEWRL